jgi:hypothetical protein
LSFEFLFEIMASNKEIIDFLFHLFYRLIEFKYLGIFFT